MDGRVREHIENAIDRLLSAIKHNNWRDVRLALTELMQGQVVLDAAEALPLKVPAYDAARGGCEFCPADGGGCCVCGHWN